MQTMCAMHGNCYPHMNRKNEHMLTNNMLNMKIYRSVSGQTSALDLTGIFQQIFYNSDILLLIVKILEESFHYDCLYFIILILCLQTYWQDTILWSYMGEKRKKRVREGIQTRANSILALTGEKAY